MAICTTIAENLAIRRHVDTPSWVRRTVVRAIWRPNLNIQVNELGGESRAMGVKVILSLKRDKVVPLVVRFESRPLDIGVAPRWKTVPRSDGTAGTHGSA
jgi:hypothetical protein